VADFGIAVYSWRRPHYLRRCLAALAANDLTGVDVHVWQEGERCRVTGVLQTEPATIAANLRVIEETLPAATIHVHEQHIGLAEQRRHVMPWMAERYPMFATLDSDVIVSQNYTAVMPSALGALDVRLASVTAGLRLRGEPDEWDVMIAGGRGWSLSAEGWRSDRMDWWPTYEDYCRVIARWPYGNLNPAKPVVADWARSIGSAIVEPSSDTALIRAEQMAGYERACLAVNRASNIGVDGLNARSDDPNMPWHIINQPIHECEWERNITDWRIRWQTN